MPVLFDPEKHVRNVLDGNEVKMLNPDGSVLSGIRGVSGVAELLDLGAQMGIDRIIMEPGSRFEVHTHPGGHVLYVLRSAGYIHVNGVDYDMEEGDTVYVPANFPHGIKTNPQVGSTLELLAIGVPHMPIDSTSRMTLVDG
jgi:quercetin dioxygenase-like cupin family protein